MHIINNRDNYISISLTIFALYNEWNVTRRFERYRSSEAVGLTHTLFKPLELRNLYENAFIFWMNMEVDVLYLEGKACDKHIHTCLTIVISKWSKPKKPADENHAASVTDQRVNSKWTEKERIGMDIKES